jgi:hypothetical protein
VLLYKKAEVLDSKYSYYKATNFIVRDVDSNKKVTRVVYEHKKLSFLRAEYRDDKVKREIKIKLMRN